MAHSLLIRPEVLQQNAGQNHSDYYVGATVWPFVQILNHTAELGISKRCSLHKNFVLTGFWGGKAPVMYSSLPAQRDQTLLAFEMSSSSIQEASGRKGQ